MMMDLGLQNAVVNGGLKALSVKSRLCGPSGVNRVA